jgi:hypothetical protein
MDHIDTTQFEGPEARSVAFTDLDVKQNGRGFEGLRRRVRAGVRRRPVR